MVLDVDAYLIWLVFHSNFQRDAKNTWLEGVKCVKWLIGRTPLPPLNMKVESRPLHSNQYDIGEPFLVFNYFMCHKIGLLGKWSSFYLGLILDFFH